MKDHGGQIFLNKKSNLTAEIEAYNTDFMGPGGTEFDEMKILSVKNEIDMIIPDVRDDVKILAIKKNNLNTEDTIMMLVDPEKIADLEQELDNAGDTSAIPILDPVVEPDAEMEEADESEEIEESRLNMILSNKTEYFDLLFELLNLGVPEITV